MSHRPDIGSSLATEDEMTALVIDPSWSDADITTCLLDEWDIETGWTRAVWRSCSVAWRKANGVYEEGGYWWAPEGDGADSIHVAELDL